MSPDLSKASRFEFEKVDWNEFESHRPPYTSALQGLIFQHHGQHGGRLDTALDAGAGGGTVTKILLDHFQRVICTDAVASYVSQAKDRFSAEADAGRVTFLQRKFDEFDAPRDLPDGLRVDMVTAGTAIHFGDPAKITEQLGSLLRPGGTLAAFCYGVIPILPPGDEADSLVRQIQDKVVRWIHETKTPLDNLSSTGTGQARYDNVVFDRETWKDVRRITSLRAEYMWPKWVNACASRVDAESEKVEIVDDDLIVKTVGYDFFPQYFQNLAPGFDISDLIKDDLARLREALEGREVPAKWPMAMVIATKR